MKYKSCTIGCCGGQLYKHSIRYMLGTWSLYNPVTSIFWHQFADGKNTQFMNYI